MYIFMGFQFHKAYPPHIYKITVHESISGVKVLFPCLVPNYVIEHEK
jgi:hypothetical protein